jgi:hypothetical protein
MQGYYNPCIDKLAELRKDSKDSVLYRLIWRKQDTAPLINSEYGGVSAGGGDRDISWVFLFLTNLLRKHDKICGYIYTELEDIEWEHNGFMNYDRSPKEFNYPAGITLADLQNEEFPILDCPPYQRVDGRRHGWRRHG